MRIFRSDGLARPMRAYHNCIDAGFGAPGSEVAGPIRTTARKRQGARF